MAREGVLKISVLGAGAWGTALANLAARGGREPRSETAVTLYAREEAHVAEMAATGVNARRLPGVPLLSQCRADRRSRSSGGSRRLPRRRSGAGAARRAAKSSPR